MSARGDGRDGHGAGGERGVARGSGDGHPRGPKAAEPRLPGRSGAVFAWLIRRVPNSGDQRRARKVFAKSGFGSAGSRCQTGVPASRGFFSLPVVPSLPKLCKAGRAQGPGGECVPPNPGGLAPAQPLRTSHSFQNPILRLVTKSSSTKRDAETCRYAEKPFRTGDSLKSLLSLFVSSRGSLI